MKFILIAAVVLAFASIGISQDMPRPQLRLVAKTEIEENGKRFTAYELEVVNREKFDDELFVPSPALPPCGKTPNAPRTFVNIANEKGVHVYGHCGMKSNADLASIKFSVLAGTQPPKRVFIYLVDRFEQRVVKSNSVRLD
jgi:hypothetical protein